MHVLSDDPPPDRCPLCGAWVSEAPPVFVPLAPGIRQSAFAKSWDQTARAVEASSIQRADDAGDMLDRQLREAGVDEDSRRREIFELKSGLKVTNLRDPSEMREGDTSAIMPSSQAAARLSIGPSHPGFQQLAGGVPNHTPGIGPAHSGAATHAVMNGHRGWENGTPSVANPEHQARAAQMIRAGEMGRHTEK
jgi:hypothetical protein